MFLDGTPVDVVNDRNRRRGVSAWGQFAFSHFADGRGYAAFLTSQFEPETMSVGANSKRQPELATFAEKLLGQTVHRPINTRLQMSDAQDRLSLAYNTFFSDLYVPPPSARAVSLRFVITGRGRPADDPTLTLQLVLKAGEMLTTGAGPQITLSGDRLELSNLGGWISHRGWKLKVDPTAKLVWPVYPFNPYANAPETNIQYAVGALSVPLRLKSQPGRYIRTNEQEIVFGLEVQ
jgi:hypothetical protein